MAAPTMTHVICTGALIVLIFTMQSFYLYVVDNMKTEITRKELKEIADYVSDTIGNLYFLVNSTDTDITLEKDLELASDVEKNTYLVKIIFDEQNSTAKYVQASLKDNSWINATSWLLPGLTVDQNKCTVESGDKTLVAGCRRNSFDVIVWIEEKG